MHLPAAVRSFAGLTGFADVVRQGWRFPDVAKSLKPTCRDMAFSRAHINVAEEQFVDDQPSWYTNRNHVKTYRPRDVFGICVAPIWSISRLACSGVSRARIHKGIERYKAAPA